MSSTLLQPSDREQGAPCDKVTQEQGAVLGRRPAWQLPGSQNYCK